MIPCYFIAAFVHELGHLFTGIFNGWKIFLLVVGPFGLKRKDDGDLTIYFEKNILLWGGVAGSFPMEENEKNIEVWRKVLLAGPLASIILGIIFTPIGIYYDHMFSLLLGAMSLAMGVMSILPFPVKTGIFYIDGYRWIRLKKSHPGYIEEAALFRLTEFQFFKKDYKFFEADYINALQQSNHRSIQYYGLYVAFHYLKAIGNQEKLEAVETKMKEMESKIPKMIVNDLKSELAK
jgi:predicted membrane protein